jgi:hypothetical protein
MASKRQQAVSAAMDDAAILAAGRDAANELALLVRAISRRHLWHEIAWDGSQAEADAMRDVARVRRALELVGRG